MKTLNNNKSGFTLIEIIVVMIIVGILAAVALPNLFSNVVKSKGSAAIASMDGVKTAVEQWATQNPAEVPTTAELVNLGLNNDYSIINAAGTLNAADLTYEIQATDNTNTVVLTRSVLGNFTCTVTAGDGWANIC